MKRIILVKFIVLLSAILFFDSCKNKSLPTISITAPTGDAGRYFPGETINFEVAINSKNELSQVTAYSTIGTSSKVIISKSTGFETSKSDNFKFSYVVKGNAGDVITVDIEAFDEYENKRMIQYTITIKEDMKETTSIIVSGPFKTDKLHFLSTETFKSYNFSGAKTNSAKIDLVYTHQNGSNGRILYSPSNTALYGTYDESTNPSRISTWDTKNVTKVKIFTLTKEKFDLIKTAANVKTYTNSLTTTNLAAYKLVAGSVFAFTTAAGKHGVGYVEAITGTSYNDTENTIKLTLKTTIE